MKKIISLLLAFILILSLSPNVFAIGEITGTVRYTDIKAYINGLPIKSYNIDNRTCIIAEDLRNYGFDVIWNPETRTLEIAHSIFAYVNSTYQFEENTKPVGYHAGYVYRTDIKTFVNGKQVTAFNIGGYTLIYIDDLMCYGDVIWNPEKREITYSRTEPWKINLADESISSYHHDDPFDDKTNEITEISINYTKNEDGTYNIQGKNLNHISWINLSYSKESGGMKLGFSLVANHLFGDREFSKLCSDVSTVKYDDEKLQNSAELANQHAKVYINGHQVKITEVTQGKGNNHMDYYFVLDSGIQKNDIKSFEFIFGL